MIPALRTSVARVLIALAGLLYTLAMRLMPKTGDERALSESRRTGRRLPRWVRRRIGLAKGRAIARSL